MQWKDIDFENKIWYIEKTKNGAPLSVPLINDAINILNEIKKSPIYDKNNKWVLPSKNSISGHIESPKRAWNNLLKNADIKDLTIHDLRRTLGSYQAIIGSNQFIIKESLGHKSLKSTEIYARLSNKPIEDSMQKAIDLLFQK